MKVRNDRGSDVNLRVETLKCHRFPMIGITLILAVFSETFRNNLFIIRNITYLRWLRSVRIC